MMRAGSCLVMTCYGTFAIYLLGCVFFWGGGEGNVTVDIRMMPKHTQASVSTLALPHGGMFRMIRSHSGVDVQGVDVGYWS
jgi:hypothetical protein